MQRLIKISVALSGLATVVSAAALSAVGVRVADSSGKPLANALVTLLALPEYRGEGGRLTLVSRNSSSSATTDKTGSVILSAATGRYIACAIVPGQSYVDPCKWGSATMVEVGSPDGTTTAIAIQKGVNLTLNLADPNNILSRPSGPLGPYPVSAGVAFGRGAFIGADPTQVPGGYKFSLIIPNDRALVLRLSSRIAKFTDDFGEPYAATDARYVIDRPKGDVTFSFVATR